jgi:hypothetical protein
MYLFRWHKPFLPNEPIVLRDDRYAPLAAFMFVSSDMSGYFHETEVSESSLKALFVRWELYTKLPELDTVCFRGSAPSSGSNLATEQRQRMDSDTLVGIDKLASKEASAAHLEAGADLAQLFRDRRLHLQRSRDHCTVALDDERHKDMSAALFERKPRMLDRRPTMYIGSRADERRWELVQDALATCPALLENRVFLMHPAAAAGPQVDDRRESELCIHLRSEQLVAPRIQNWPSTDLMRNIEGFYVGMVLWFASFVYGGIHAAAWNEHFPSTPEKWLWRASAAYIGFAGGLWTLINLCALQIPWVKRYYERWAHGKVGWVDGIALGGVMVVCGTSFLVARVYIVVEAFVSIRSLQAAAYDTPQWTNVFPHF